MPYSAFVDARLLWAQFVVVSQPMMYSWEGQIEPSATFQSAGDTLLNELVYFVAILLHYSSDVCMCMLVFIILLSCLHACPPAAASGKGTTFVLAALWGPAEMRDYIRVVQGFSKECIRKCIKRMLFSLKRNYFVSGLLSRWKMEQQNPHNLVFVLMRMREIQKKCLCIVGNEHCLVEEDLVVSQRPQLMYFGEKAVQLNMAERRIIRRILPYSKWAFVSKVVLVYNLHFKFIQMFYFHEYAQSFSAKRGYFWLGVL